MCDNRPAQNQQISNQRLCQSPNDRAPSNFPSNFKQTYASLILSAVPQHSGYFSYPYWLIHQGKQGNVKVPIEIYEEIKLGKKDALASWAKEKETEAALRIDEEVDIGLVQQVTEHGYAPDLTDIEIEKIGRDPFLIAYALADPHDRIVVTTEVSKPTRQRANRHVPDVCNQFDVRSISAYQLGHSLDFRTNWR